MLLLMRVTPSIPLPAPAVITNYNSFHIIINNIPTTAFPFSLIQNNNNHNNNNNNKYIVLGIQK